MYVFINFFQKMLYYKIFVYTYWLLSTDGGLYVTVPSINKYVFKTFKIYTCQFNQNGSNDQTLL